MPSEAARTGARLVLRWACIVNAEALIPGSVACQSETRLYFTRSSSLDGTSAPWDPKRRRPAAVLRQCLSKENDYA